MEGTDPLQPVGEVLRKLHQQQLDSFTTSQNGESPVDMHPSQLVHSKSPPVPNQLKPQEPSLPTSSLSSTKFNTFQNHASMKLSGELGPLLIYTGTFFNNRAASLQSQSQHDSPQMSIKSKPYFSIDNLLADRMKSIESMIVKKHPKPDDSLSASSTKLESTSPKINSHVKMNTIINKHAEPLLQQSPIITTAAPEPPLPEPAKKVNSFQRPVLPKVLSNGTQKFTTPVSPISAPTCAAVNGKPKIHYPAPSKPVVLAKQTFPEKSVSQSNSEGIFSTKDSPTGTPTPVQNKNLVPTSEPTFKVPSPTDIEKLRRAQWEQQKREKEKAHNKSIIWSRTQTNPPIETFPPKPKRFEYNRKLEKPTPKVEPLVEVVKPRPPIKAVLGEFSVDTIFLALTQETSFFRTQPLVELVREKQNELQSAAVAQSETSVNTGEDGKYALRDLKKLEEEVKKDSEELPSNESRSPSLQLMEQLPPEKVSPTTAHSDDFSLAKKKGVFGRPKGSKKTKSGSDTDTESLSEERDEFYTHDDEFDIEKAVRAIDDVHDKVKLSRKCRNSRTVSDERDSPDVPIPQVARPTKRKSLQEAAPFAPKQRRSKRLKNSTAKMEDFFYESAVAVQSEHDESPESPREENTRTDETTYSKQWKTSNSISRRQSAASLEAESIAGPSNPKKTRFGPRMEYSRRVSNETILSLLGKILTPNAAENCVIRDYFPSPIVRRAIVNRNTLCYAISMVQLLLRVPQVYSIIRSHSHKNKYAEPRECFLCMMAAIISERPRADDTPAFIAVLKSSWKNMESEEMHCVMEAMQHFFYKFDEEYMNEHPDYVGKLPTVCSPIRSFFEIDLVLNYKCKSCSHTSTSPDKAIYISVDLTKKSDGSMQSMVDNMANPVAVHGMVCPSCGKEALCSSTRFTKLPEVLLYFVPRVRSKKREKDMTVINVQKQLILSDNIAEHKYALCAFLTHCGLTGNKGHYKAFEVDRSGEFQYNEFDDAKVTINSKLSNDITIVLAMFRKEEAVAKDDPTDLIFDGRGNIMFAHENHCKQD